MIKCTKRLLVTVAVLFTALLFLSCSKTEETSANISSEVSRSQKMRVIANLPNITQIMFDAGIDDLLVGVTDFCDIPETRTDIVRIGGIMNPDFERIIALKPDLIIVQDTLRELEKKYNDLGFKTLQTKVHSINDIYVTIRAIGKATGNTIKTDRLLEKMDKELDEIKRFTTGKQAVRTLLVIGNDQNSLREIWAAGGNTFYNEMLKLVGGKNILEDSVVDYPVISKEEILKQSPEVILVLTGKDMTKADIKREIEKWNVLSYVSAVKNKRVHIIPGKEAHIPGARTPQTAKMIQKALFNLPD